MLLSRIVDFSVPIQYAQGMAQMAQVNRQNQAQQQGYQGNQFRQQSGF